MMGAGGVGGGDRLRSGSGRREAALCLTVTVFARAQCTQMGWYGVKQAAARRESEGGKDKMSVRRVFAWLL